MSLCVQFDSRLRQFLSSQDDVQSTYSHDLASSAASSTPSLDDANFLQVDSPLSNSRSYRPTSFLMMNSPITPSFSALTDVPPSATGAVEEQKTFSRHTDLLDYVTKNWQSDFVTIDLTSQVLLEKFSTRPFFMVISVDAPILVRYHRSLRHVQLYFYGLDNRRLTVHLAELLAPEATKILCGPSYRNMTTISTATATLLHRVRNPSLVHHYKLYIT